MIPADAEVITYNDFSVNEAMVTGESVSIPKQTGEQIIQGTLVVGGYCYARVKAVGGNTTLSTIGRLVKDKSIRMKNRLVPLIIGVSFVLLLLINYLPLLNGIFEIDQLTFQELLGSLFIGVVATLWIEFFKR